MLNPLVPSLRWIEYYLLLYIKDYYILGRLRSLYFLRTKTYNYLNLHNLFDRFTKYYAIVKFSFLYKNYFVINKYVSI